MGAPGRGARAPGQPGTSGGPVRIGLPTADLRSLAGSGDRALPAAPRLEVEGKAGRPPPAGSGLSPRGRFPDAAAPAHAPSPWAPRPLHVQRWECFRHCWSLTASRGPPGVSAFWYLSLDRSPPASDPVCFVWPRASGRSAGVPLEGTVWHKLQLLSCVPSALLSLGPLVRGRQSYKEPHKAESRMGCPSGLGLPSSALSESGSRSRSPRQELR